MSYILDWFANPIYQQSPLVIALVITAMFAGMVLYDTYHWVRSVRTGEFGRRAISTSVLYAVLSKMPWANKHRTHTTFFFEEYYPFFHAAIIFMIVIVPFVAVMALWPLVLAVFIALRLIELLSFARKHHSDVLASEKIVNDNQQEESLIYETEKE